MKSICEILRGLPCHSPNVYGSGRWLDDTAHFPKYAEVFSILRPTSLLEIGAFTGYSICTAAYECPTLERIEWIDNESGCAGSNEMVRRNLESIDKSIAHKCWRSTDEATPTTPVDVIHIDADHSYRAAMKDLEYAASLGPKWIIGHDFELPGAGVKQAVLEFMNGTPPLTYPVTNGLFIIPSDWDEARRLFPYQFPAEIPEQENDTGDETETP